MVDPVSYFSFQPALYDKGMMHIKDPLLLIEKSRPCINGSGFPLSLAEWSFTI